MFAWPPGRLPDEATCCQLLPLSATQPVPSLPARPGFRLGWMAVTVDAVPGDLRVSNPALGLVL